MQQPLSVLLCQFNPIVGAIAANTARIIELIGLHSDVDLIIFPELAICGYPPEDLLFRPSFHQQIEQALNLIATNTNASTVIVGHPCMEAGLCYNAASIFHQGSRIAHYYKQHLPNYGIFDEVRYFTQGSRTPCILTIKNHRIGLCICEDIWLPGPVEQLLDAQIDSLVCINASPFEYNKQALREQLLLKYARCGINIFYVNQVGGQDELVFDGQSMAIDKQGSICARLPPFQEQFQQIIINQQTLVSETTPSMATEQQLIYEALVCGTQNYIDKNGFPGVLLGLSGGVDSALTLAIAVDALGPHRVHAVMMPSRYTAPISIEDAQQQIKTLSVCSTILSIEPTFKSFLKTLAPCFHQLPPDTTEENIQARIRGTLLMALSNKSGNLVLTTSNKSEMAVGYATLYGDMAGGFAVLKDVLKTQIYALCAYRNQLSFVIPERVIKRPPSAELAPHQTDQDSLPEYAILDMIIKEYMENNLSAEEIIQKGLPATEVQKILNLIKRNEYKRRQAPPGIKISPRAFGRDWRYPITSKF